MSLTLDVSKLSGWLNADAPWNMPDIEMTDDVSKFTGELKVDQKLSRRRQGSGSSALMLNIAFMSVT